MSVRLPSWRVCGSGSHVRVGRWEWGRVGWGVVVVTISHFCMAFKLESMGVEGLLITPSPRPSHRLHTPFPPSGIDPATFRHV